MTCDEVRALLESYVSGDAGDDTLAVAEHLAGCSECAAEEALLRELADELRQAGDAFRPRLLPPESTLQRAVVQARRRRLTLAVAACVAGLFAALAVAMALPATARHLPLPVGLQLRQLDDRVAGLDAVAATTQGELAKTQAELALRRQAARFVILPAGRHGATEARVLRSVAVFFAARAGVAVPGRSAAKAKAKLAQVTLPGSQAAQLSAAVLPGTQRVSSAARLTNGGTVVVVTGLRLLSRTRALVYVRAFDYGVWAGSSGASPTSRPRPRTYWSEAVHRVLLVRDSTGRWLVAEDQSSAQPAVTGAPAAPSVVASGPEPSASTSGRLANSGSTPSSLATPASTPTASPTSMPTATPAASPSSP